MQSVQNGHVDIKQEQRNRLVNHILVRLLVVVLVALQELKDFLSVLEHHQPLAETHILEGHLDGLPVHVLVVSVQDKPCIIFSIQ